MNPKILTTLLLLTLAIGCSNTADEAPAYQDATAEIDTRVADLLARMTLDEKIKQMDMYHANHLISNGRLDSIKVDSMLVGLGAGSVHDFYPETAEASNELQRYIIENSRLGIPVLFIEEALHGYQGNQSTAFPTPIGLASMWDVDLMKKVGHTIGAEARSVGVSMVLAPTLGIGREPRWGRVQETYGEDAYLAARNGVAIIQGMQGDDLTADDAIVAEPKHFGMHSIPEGGKNTAPVYMGEREARTNFLYVFEKAFIEAEALGAMAAYHEWDGIPAASDPWLLKEVLRDEWGFKGMVISDLGAIVRQSVTHYTAKTQKEAVASSISAGLDMQFYDYTHPDYENAIKDALNEGLLAMDDVDRAVSAVLYVKFRLGLFENPYVAEHLKEERYHCESHQQLALEAGEKSIVLLQNNDDALPINTEKVKKIAVIGELADKALLGGYSPKKVEGVSIIEALKETDFDVDFVDVSTPDNAYMATVDGRYFQTGSGEKGVTASYFANTSFSGEPVLTQKEEDIANYWHNLSPAPGVPSDNFSIRWEGHLVPPNDGVYELAIHGEDVLRLFVDDALFLDCKKEENGLKSKSISLKAGRKYKIKMEHIEYDDNAGASLLWHIPTDSQGKSIFQEAVQAASDADLVLLVLGERDEHGEGKDKTDLQLSELSRQLIDEISVVKAKKVLVLQNGRPPILSDITAKVDAILETWYAGEKSGQATVNVLTGAVNPSGKLPISFPRSNGQIPIYYNQKKSSNGTYMDNSNKPLFPFGHGLSYSQFNYENLQVAQPKISTNDTQKISVVVSNTSDVAGEETVQLYIQDMYSSVGTPVLSLKGFKRVPLKPGEQKTVEFSLSPEDLSLWNRDMKRVVEPGEFKVIVGASSADLRLESGFLVE